MCHNIFLFIYDCKINRNNGAIRIHIYNIHRVSIYACYLEHKNFIYSRDFVLKHLTHPIYHIYIYTQL